MLLNFDNLTKKSNLVLDNTDVSTTNTAAYFIGQLEQLDKKVYLPEVAITYYRDVPLRSDITPAMQITSFMKGTFGRSGDSGTKFNFIGQDTNTTSKVSVGTQLTRRNVRTWAEAVPYNYFQDLQERMANNLPLEDLKIRALHTDYDMQVDELAYIGATDISADFYGMLNIPEVIASETDLSGINFETASQKDILNALNNLIYSVWEASAFTVMPDRILFPPKILSTLASRPSSDLTVKSILEYLKSANIARVEHGIDVKFMSTKWQASIVGNPVGGHIGRIACYKYDYNYMRLPVSKLWRHPEIYASSHFDYSIAYVGVIGELELVRNQTIRYAKTV